MSEKYAAYLELLATRDRAMNSLALLAIGVVLGWFALRLLPERARLPMQRLYLAGGLVLYILTLILVASIPVPTP